MKETKEMLYDQWPTLAILVVLGAYTVYAMAQASKNDQIAATIERRGGGVNRIPIRDAFQREIDSQSIKMAGWEDEVFDLHSAVGSHRTEMSRNLNKMATGFDGVQRSGKMMTNDLGNADAETKRTASNLEDFTQAAMQLKEARGESVKTDSQVKDLETKVSSLNNSVVLLQKDMKSIYEAIVDEEGD